MSISQAAQILPWEKGPGGKVLDAKKTKARQTCWECHHANAPFEGPIEHFGRLYYYLDKSGHPLAPPSIPGIFIGWRIESGMRYRHVLKVISYVNARKHNFQQRSILNIPSKEVHFPTELSFPFAKARNIAIETMAEFAPPGLPTARSATTT